MRIEYKGVTEDLRIVGCAVFRFDEEAAFTAAGVKYSGNYGFSRFWKENLEGKAWQAEAVLGYQFWELAGKKLNTSLRRTFSHEMGHTVGHGPHLTGNDSVMGLRGFITPLRYTPGWPDYKDFSVDGASHKHTELNPENGLFIPGLIGEGDPTVMAADLAYTGNGLKHTWRLRHIFPAGEGAPICNETPINRDQPDLHLTDVRSFHLGNLKTAKLRFIGNDTWELEHAE